MSITEESVVFLGIDGMPRLLRKYSMDTIEEGGVKYHMIFQIA